MNKTLNINLGGLIFHIDEDAYNRLEKYLYTLKRQFANTEGGDEIVKDVEMRIAELFRDRTSEAKEVISSKDVDEVIEVMGKPEDYLDAEDEEEYAREKTRHFNYASSKRFFRDPDDRMIGGVASGLAAYFNIETLWIRILFVVLLLSGFGFLFYIILWVVIPKAVTTADKLQMRGESVNISNIERSIREEMDQVGDNIKDFSKKAANYDYSRPTRQAGGFFREVADFIVNAFKLIFKVIFKLIGFFFIAIGFMVLLGLVIALFTGGTYLIGTGYGFNDFIDFLQILTVNDSHFNMMVIGIALLVLAPLILIVYLGIRIIFKLDRLGRPARSGLIGMAVLGFVLVLIAGIRIGVEFDNYSNYTTTTSIKSKADVFYLKAQEDDIYQEYKDGNFISDWLVTDRGHAFNFVSLNIEKSPDSNMTLRQRIFSEGSSRKAARNHAQRLTYRTTVSDSLLEFPTYFLLEEEMKFRDQEVSLTLFIPVGTSIYLDNNMLDVIYDLQNVNDYYDIDMLNHTWLMTERGLQCTDCSDPYQYDDEDEWEEEDEEDAEDIYEVEESDEEPYEEVEEDEEIPLQAFLNYSSKLKPAIYSSISLTLKFI